MKKYFSPGKPTPYISIITNPNTAPILSFRHMYAMSDLFATLGSKELAISKRREMNITKAIIVI
jgi:hypothetical protein